MDRALEVTCRSSFPKRAQHFRCAPHGLSRGPTVTFAVEPSHAWGRPVTLGPHIPSSGGCC